MALLRYYCRRCRHTGGGRRFRRKRRSDGSWSRSGQRTSRVTVEVLNEVADVVTLFVRYFNDVEGQREDFPTSMRPDVDMGGMNHYGIESLA